MASRDSFTNYINHATLISDAEQGTCNRGPSTQTRGTPRTGKVMCRVDARTCDLSWVGRGDVACGRVKLPNLYSDQRIPKISSLVYHHCIFIVHKTCDIKHIRVRFVCR